ncbi:l-threonine 3-dehydrogenase [Platysternon megacephalum]|uniref:L-threonine 3-dehydrogenase n=1 Tax=Platysternon megacephalum TaxID=55544 RepID=A0A4D9DL24_9SAUR|nr:l-threonine 3-dehydrogenase [Platysternon megacephalum]
MWPTPASRAPASSPYKPCVVQSVMRCLSKRLTQPEVPAERHRRPFSCPWGAPADLPRGAPNIEPLFDRLLIFRSDRRNPPELSERYGPVYTLHLGSRPVVVLCGYQAVKEALLDQAEEFSGRGDLPVVFRFTQGNGVVLSNGEKWKVLRRFALQTLRNFGMGKRSLEERIQQEAQCLGQELAQTQSAPFDPTFLISRAVSNVICSIVFGDRFEYQDWSFLTWVGLINQNFQLLSSPWGQMYNIFPGPMSCLPGPHNRIFENFEQLRLFVLERVTMHQESFDPNGPRDFIDCFLLKMEQENQDPLSYFQTETLVMTTHNLFFAGTETVSTTLRYGFLLLMKYPEIQGELRGPGELRSGSKLLSIFYIDQVIGRHRSPSVEDRSRMPYTDAVIHEVQRFGDVIPMGVPHAVTRDTRFRGFLLPEGTNVLPLLFSVHNDPAQFKDPATFDPAHFLDPSGGFRKHDAFMAFSTGKRICLGEGLARMELFLFFAAVLQRFALTPLGRPEDIDISPLMSGLGNVPRPYEFRAVPR